MFKAKVVLFAIGCLMWLSPGLRGQPPIPQKLTLHAQPPEITHAGPGNCIDGSGKICVTEMKPTTKTAYSSVNKEYCQRSVSLLGWLKNLCGDECADGGEVRTKRVLIKKTVPGPDAPTCVLKDVTPGKPAFSILIKNTLSVPVQR